MLAAAGRVARIGGPDREPAAPAARPTSMAAPSRTGRTAVPALLLALTLAACAVPGGTGTPAGGATSGTTGGTGTGAGTGTASPGPGTPPAGGSRPPATVVLTGTVTAAPGCPGPQAQDSPCPGRPVRGARVEVYAAGRLVAGTTTDASGRFRLAVPTGRYTITAHNVGLPTQVSRDVTVTGPLDVDLVVDSGMQ